MVPIAERCRDALRLAESQGSIRLAEALRDVLSSIEAEANNAHMKDVVQLSQTVRSTVTFR